jgi:hypothetical protein
VEGDFVRRTKFWAGFSSVCDEYPAHNERSGLTLSLDDSSPRRHARERTALRATIHPAYS